jgi:hypothetical protein
MTMQTYQATASADIQAPAALVYSIIADYRAGHPHILPRPFFQSLDVEQGGTGTGTVIRFQTQAFGKTQTFRAAISEPEPGRVLVETDLDGGPVSTFVVDPLEGGCAARVTITTVGKVREGLPGRVEGVMTRLCLENIYAQELKLLAEVARARAPVEASHG